MSVNQINIVGFHQVLQERRQSLVSEYWAIQTARIDNGRGHTLPTKSEGGNHRENGGRPGEAAGRNARLLVPGISGCPRPIASLPSGLDGLGVPIQSDVHRNSSERSDCPVRFPGGVEGYRHIWFPSPDEKVLGRARQRTGGATKDPVSPSASVSSGMAEIHQEASWQLQKSE